MMRRALAVAVAFAWTHAVCAAELPSRNAKSTQSDQKAHDCMIDGEHGIELPGGTCMRISGYVSTGVSAGTIKH
jgi:hypothetical protein